jgi:putative autoinducer-2 (AI-2) aldolase
MNWGMKNRLSKIIKPKDGHTVMLAVDHGYFMGLRQVWKNSMKW